MGSDARKSPNSGGIWGLWGFWGFRNCSPEAPQGFGSKEISYGASKKRNTNLTTHVKVIYFFFFFKFFDISLPHLRFPKFCTTDHQVRESQPFAEFPSYKAKKQGKKGGKEGWVGEITKKGKRRVQGMETNPSGNCTWEHGQSGCIPLEQRDCAGPQGPSLEY